MRLATAFLLIATAIGPAIAGNLVTVESKHSVKETVDRLVAAIEKRGIKVAARIDHAAGAKAAGMELPPTEVLLFGSPKLGTPLMQANPAIAIDLPMSILTWQDKSGKVWIGYTSPDDLKSRHGVVGQDQVFSTMRAALDGIVKNASDQ